MGGWVFKLVAFFVAETHTKNIKISHEHRGYLWLPVNEAIEKTTFKVPICPIYQNVTGKAVKDPEEIKNNLIIQLTAPVLWTQTIENMVIDGANLFVEAGPGKVLQGLVKKINKMTVTESLEETINSQQ